MERKKLVDWTPTTTLVASSTVSVLATGFLIGLEPTQARLSIAGVVVVSLVIALAVDAYLGLVIALATAALVIVLKQAFGLWSEAAFLHTVALTVSLLVSVWTFSIVGGNLRKVTRQTAGPLEPVARDHIIVEHARARAHGRPLGLLAVTVARAADDFATDDDIKRAERELLRLLSNVADPTDVPFRLTDAEFGLILVEKFPDEGWSKVADLTDALTHATVTLGEAQIRRSVADFLDMGFGLAWAQDHPRAEAFIDAATNSARKALAQGSEG